MITLNFLKISYFCEGKNYHVCTCVRERERKEEIQHTCPEDVFSPLSTRRILPAVHLMLLRRQRPLFLPTMTYSSWKCCRLVVAEARNVVSLSPSYLPLKAHPRSTLYALSTVYFVDTPNKFIAVTVQSSRLFLATRSSSSTHSHKPPSPGHAPCHWQQAQADLTVAQTQACTHTHAQTLL